MKLYFFSIFIILLFFCFLNKKNVIIENYIDEEEEEEDIYNDTSTYYNLKMTNNTYVSINITKLHINVYNCDINNIIDIKSSNESIIDSSKISLDVDNNIIEITDMNYSLEPLEELRILDIVINNSSIECDFSVNIDSEFSSVLDSIDTGYSTKIIELVDNYLNDNVDSDYNNEEIKKGINNYIKIKLNEFIENNYNYLDNINLLLNEDGTENENLYYNYIIMLLNALPDIETIISYSLISVNVTEYCLI